MFKGTLKTKSSGEVNRSFIASLRTFNLMALIERMNFKPIWSKGKLHSMVLLNRPDKQILLTTFDKGTEINSFQANEQMTLQVIWGKLKFRTMSESKILKKSQFITLHEKTYYNLTTSEKTVFLLTLISGAQGQTNSNFTEKEVL